MKQILAIVFVAFASPSLAGVCNSVGGFTHCSGDDGSQTNIQRNGDYYQVQRQGKDGRVTTEGYWNYNHDDDSGDR